MDATPDRIGDRLEHPECVPDHLKHLIADDQQRVERILQFPVSGWVADLGCSDGAITARIQKRWQVKVLAVDQNPDAIAQVEARRIDHCVTRCCDLGDLERRDLEGCRTVYATEILEHLDQATRRHVLSLASLVSNLIVTVPNRTPHYDYVKAGRGRWAWPTHRATFTYREFDHLLSEYFPSRRFVSLYPHEHAEESIYLIARCYGWRGPRR